jgi:uncharacterized protein (DUF2267 family)
MSKQSVFGDTVVKATDWLHEVMKELSITDERQGLRALRAGLHAIRDRLPAGEVVDLGAQLPVVIRGYYYDGWRLANNPAEVRTREQMIARVKDELGPGPHLDPEASLKAVIHVLAWHISPGEMDEIVGTLPRKLAELFSDSMA